MVTEYPYIYCEEDSIFGKQKIPIDLFLIKAWKARYQLQFAEDEEEKIFEMLTIYSYALAVNLVLGPWWKRASNLSSTPNGIK